MRTLHSIAKSLYFNFLKHDKYRQIVLLFCLCFLFLLISVASLYFPLTKTLTYDEQFYYRTGLAILSGKPSELGEIDINMRNIMPVSAVNPLLGESIPNQVISKLAKVETVKKAPSFFLLKSNN